MLAGWWLALATGALAAALTFPAVAESPLDNPEDESRPQRAGIPFADLGGIRSWRPDGDRGIYVQGRRGEWYYAEFFGPCTGLLFNDRIAFITDTGTSRLDRFSSILVDGERCHFRTFEAVDEPGQRR
jgi:hypothetical protein